jgi:hypothetical protein
VARGPGPQISDMGLPSTVAPCRQISARNSGALGALGVQKRAPLTQLGVCQKLPAAWAACQWPIEVSPDSESEKESGLPRQVTLPCRMCENKRPGLSRTVSSKRRWQPGHWQSVTASFKLSQPGTTTLY